MPTEPSYASLVRFRSSLASNISCNHLFLAVFFKRFEEAAEIAANYIAKSVLKDVEKVRRS